jgi:hypothetical protein
MAVASLAVTSLLFEACGGDPGGPVDGDGGARDAAPERILPDVQVVDATSDGLMDMGDARRD